MSMKYPKKERRTGQEEQDAAANLIEELKAFEEYKLEILPMLRSDIKNGTPPEEMRKKYQSYIEARKISIALTDQDSAIALSAARELTDRTEGKAVERKQVTHKYANLKDEELDAILTSEISGLETYLPN